MVEGKKHVLTGTLAAYAQAYGFTSFTFATMEKILDGYRKTAYRASRFKGELSEPKPGVTPDDIVVRVLTWR